MSDRPHGEGWWLASDGKWYPPEAAPGQPLPPPPPQRRGGEASPPARPGSGLSLTLRILLYVTAVLALVVTAVTVNEIAKYDEFIDDPTFSTLAELVDAEDLSAAMLGLTFVVGLVAAALLIMWTYQAYGVTDRFRATGRRWSAGWAVGGWFVPFANLVIPKLVINEIDRISSDESGAVPVEDRWMRVRTLAVGNWWWGLWIAAAIIVSVGAAISGAEVEEIDFDADVYRFGLYAVAVGFVVLAGAAAAAASFVQQLGTRLRGW